MAMIETHWKAFYEETLRLPVPDIWKIRNYNLPAAPVLTKDDIRQRLVEALNFEIIQNRLKEKPSVCILLDDLARPIVWEPVLSVLCELLVSHGIPEKSITLLVGLAGHEQLSSEELFIKFGRQICHRFRIEQHDLSTPMTWFDAGKFKFGINKTYTDAQLKIVLGSVIPHPFAGFSGGGKAILPGISDLESVCRNHRLASFGQGKVADTDNNIRKQMEEIGERVGIDILVNALCDRQRDIIGLFCGQRANVFSQAVDAAIKHYGVRIKQVPDFLFLNAYPKDLDIVQVMNVFNVVRTMDKNCLAQIKAIVLFAPVPKKNGRHALFAPGGVLYKSPKKILFLNEIPMICWFPGLSEENFYEMFAPETCLCQTWEEVVEKLKAIYTGAAEVAIFHQASMQFCRECPEF